MNELHWTGAALLLAVAALGRLARPGCAANLCWVELGRQHGLEREPRRAAAGSSAAPSAPPRAVQDGQVAGLSSDSPPIEGEAPTRRLYRATAICLHCGRTAGDFEWDAAATWAGVVLRPAAGGACQPVPSGARVRCEHCGGPVCPEQPEPVRVPPDYVLPRTASGRLRKTPTLRAS
jgi:hypothetical protein